MVWRLGAADDDDDDAGCDDRRAGAGAVCSIYVEREESSSKLYVTNIESGDRGSYKCLRMHGGAQREEKSVTLSIFS